MFCHSFAVIIFLRDFFKNSKNLPFSLKIISQWCPDRSYLLCLAGALRSPGHSKTARRDPKPLNNLISELLRTKTYAIRICEENRKTVKP